MTTADTVERAVAIILGLVKDVDVPRLDVAGLNAVYDRLHKETGAAPRITILGLEDRLIVRFPELNSPLMMVDVPRRVDAKTELKISDWLVTWVGPTSRGRRFWQFLTAEIVENWLFLVVTGGLVGIGLWAVADAALLESLIELGVTSLSIFLGIFVLFIVGEPGRLASDFDLFRRGRLHEFIRTDQHIASLALLTLGIGFLNLVVIKSDTEWALLGLALDRVRVWGVVGTTVFLVLLIHLLRSIPNYYFERLQVRIEREAIEWTLTRPTSSAKSDDDDPAQSPR